METDDVGFLRLIVELIARLFDVFVHAHDHRVGKTLMFLATIVTLGGFAFGVYEYFYGDFRDLFRNDCEQGMVLSPGDTCDYPNHTDEFRVTLAGASLLGSTSVMPSTLKVDYNGDSYTFQARELDGTNDWLIEVAGPWRDAGQPPTGFCSVGLVVEPGEYCIDEETGAQFRAYAVDLLWRGDRRPEHADGYGVLFYFGGPDNPADGEPLLSNDLVEHGSFRARVRDATSAGRARSWRIESVIWNERIDAGPLDWRVVVIDQGRQHCDLSVNSFPAAGERNRSSVRWLLGALLFCESSPAATLNVDLSGHHGDYGMRAPPDSAGCDWQGGHAGWHLQTKSVAGDEATADEIFYSLTAGTVIRSGQGTHEDDSEWSVIAVYDEAQDRTTIYKRARRLFVHRGDRVEVGDQLGVQGGRPLLYGSENELVHIEIREGRKREAACGLADGDTFDPLRDDYLVDAVLGASR